MRPGRDSGPVRRRANDVVAALRAERMRQGISQRGVGESFGASQASVGQWESRRWNPDAWTVRLWCAALGVRVPPDVDILFRPDVPRCPSRPAYERHRRRREACAVCKGWFTAHRRKPGVKPRAA